MDRKVQTSVLSEAGLHVLVRNVLKNELNFMLTIPKCTAIKWHQSNTTGSLIVQIYEGWDFNSGNFLFTTDTK